MSNVIPLKRTIAETACAIAERRMRARLAAEVKAQREADSLINAWALPPMTEEMAERIRETW